MALKSEQLPNKPLNGAEIREIAGKLFDEMLARDCMFLKQAAYRRCSLEITACFHFGYPAGDHTVKVRAPATSALESQIPLAPAAEEQTAFVALEREVNLDNPNLQRIHHGLPIIVQERQMPEPVVQEAPIPGEPPKGVLNPFPGVTNHELRYNPENFDKPAPPVDRDVTEREAARLGVKIPTPKKDRRR